MLRRHISLAIECSTLYYALARSLLCVPLMHDFIWVLVSLVGACCGVFYVVTGSALVVFPSLPVLGFWVCFSCSACGFFLVGRFFQVFSSLSRCCHCPPTSPLLVLPARVVTDCCMCLGWWREEGDRMMIIVGGKYICKRYLTIDQAASMPFIVAIRYRILVL